MIQPVLTLLLVGGAALAGRRGGGDLGAALPQNELCYFEVFEGQNPKAKTLWGSPIECIPGTAGAQTAATKPFKAATKKYAGRKGNPRVVCKFPVLRRYQDVALGVARNCRKVKG